MVCSVRGSRRTPVAVVPYARLAGLEIVHPPRLVFGHGKGAIIVVPLAVIVSVIVGVEGGGKGAIVVVLPLAVIVSGQSMAGIGARPRGRRAHLSRGRAGDG